MCLLVKEYHHYAFECPFGAASSALHSIYLHATATLYLLARKSYITLPLYVSPHTAYKIS